jgi:L,D-transpeptidase ErfK/SrfK
VTTSLQTLSRAIAAAFLLCALTATGSSAALLSVASPAATPAPSSDAKPLPAAAIVEPPAPMLPPIAHQIVGGEFDVIAAARDSFTSLGSRFGESAAILAGDNDQQVTDRLHAGDTIHVDNRHIVPLEESNFIEVNLPQRMLFHFEDGRLSGAYPVAVGQPGKQWQTPIGSFTVMQMQENPTWSPPASIQREGEEEGRHVGAIGPGPNNPLGKYWIGLSFPIVGIHGTNHPATVYSYLTHGCVRLRPENIEALFNAVDLDDRGETVYIPLMLARLDDGRIFLESEKDIYGRGTGGIGGVRALAQAAGIDSLIDWNRAGEVVIDQDGIARDVTATSELAGGAPADTIAATKVEGAITVAIHASRGLIAAAVPPH